MGAPRGAGKRSPHRDDRGDRKRPRRARARRQVRRNAPRRRAGAPRPAVAAAASGRPGRPPEGVCVHGGRVDAAQAREHPRGVGRIYPRWRGLAPHDSDHGARVGGRGHSRASLPARIIGVFTSPRATYADVSARRVGRRAGLGTRRRRDCRGSRSSQPRSASGHVDQQVQPMESFGRTMDNAAYDRMEAGLEGHLTQEQFFRWSCSP